VRKLKEVARLYLDMKLGVRSIARACTISTSTAHTYVERLKELDVPYGELSIMGDDELEDLLFPKEERVTAKPLPDFDYLVKEMKKKGSRFSFSMRNTRAIIPTDTSEAGSTASIVTG